jgi:hypothetical protein
MADVAGMHGNNKLGLLYEEKGNLPEQSNMKDTLE